MCEGTRGPNRVAWAQTSMALFFPSVEKLHFYHLLNIRLSYVSAEAKSTSCKILEVRVMTANYTLSNLRADVCVDALQPMFFMGEREQ